MARRASAGHKLGQLIGDWFEGFFVLPLLTTVSEELDLYLDNRFIDRPARGEKIIWQDADGNEVDYDFVLELNGSETKIGIPVAFIESCWRRGSRHSKDKARDDSGKLRPMRAAYPTARFLGMVISGAFTGPARELVRSREIDLFYVPKKTVVRAFLENGLVMDYPDKSPEEEKRHITAQFEAGFTAENKTAVAKSLIRLMDKAVVESYVDRVKSKLSALPQEIRFILRHDSLPVIFGSIVEATEFLRNPAFQMNDPTESYVYQVVYSDGSEFEQTVTSVDELRELHGQITILADHMNKLS
jgi:hypothetical protein